jgi:hypothetical protein
MPREHGDTLRAMLPPQYADVAFHTIKVCESSAHIFPCESRYCLTAGREHKSNRVYFLAGAGGGLHQCCFSASCGGARTSVSDQRPPFLPPIKSAKKGRAAAVKAAVKGETKEGGGDKKKRRGAPLCLMPVSAKTAIAKWTTRSR